MNRDVRNLQKLMESGALAFNMGPQAGDFADYPQSNTTVLKPSNRDTIYQIVDKQLKSAEGFLTAARKEDIASAIGDVKDSIYQKLEPYVSEIAELKMEDEIDEYIDKTIKMIKGPRMQNPTRPTGNLEG
tara:strand:+ start:751 stop:1140 length:390 start_codon:yes stop_codon:yes gene_type:complete